MNNHPWYQHCLKEIDAAVSEGRKRLSDWEKSFLSTVRPRIEIEVGLTDKQEESLRRLHCRITDPAMIRRR